MFLKAIAGMHVKLDEANDDVKSNEVNDDVKTCVRPIVVELNVYEQFTNKQEFIVREYMQQWIHVEAGKLGFDVVIRRFDNGSNRRQTFVVMSCERSGTYQPLI